MTLRFHGWQGPKSSKSPQLLLFAPHCQPTDSLPVPLAAAHKLLQRRKLELKKPAQNLAAAPGPRLSPTLNPAFSAFHAAFPSPSPSTPCVRNLTISTRIRYSYLNALLPRQH
jgi:hypothetical protein